MKCPKCRAKTRVLYTDALPSEVVRFRRCPQCGFSYETIERFICVWVRKKDEKNKQDEKVAA